MHYTGKRHNSSEGQEIRKVRESRFCFKPGRCAGSLMSSCTPVLMPPAVVKCMRSGVRKWLTRAVDVQPKWLPHPKGTGGAQQCFLLVYFYLLAC